MSQYKGSSLTLQARLCNNTNALLFRFRLDSYFDQSTLKARALRFPAEVAFR